MEKRTRRVRGPNWNHEHTRRVRGPNWNHEHTLALAELKREASLNKEKGRLVWDRTAQTLSSRFPDQIRTGDQCRRRWDNLVKVYNDVEKYFVESGAQDHRELDEDELASMKLATAYQQDWYDIVEQVCSQRERKERCDRDLMLGSGHSDRLVLEATQLRQHERVSHEVSQEPQTLGSADLLPHTFPAENGAQLKEPLQDDLWENLLDYRHIALWPKIEQSGTESELTGPFLWDRSKGSGHSVEIPEHPPNIDTLLSASTSRFVTQHGQSTPESTITYAQVSSSPSLEEDKLSPEEEVPRLENGNDVLVLEATQLRQHERVSHETLESANLLPHTFPAENGAQLKEQDEWWENFLITDTSVEIEQSGTESELTVSPSAGSAEVSPPAL